MVQEFAKLVLFAYYRQDIMDLNKFTETTFWCVKYGPDDLAILKKCNKICFTVYYIRIVTALFTAWTSALAVGIGIQMCIILQVFHKNSSVEQSHFFRQHQKE